MWHLNKALTLSTGNDNNSDVVVAHLIGSNPTKLIKTNSALDICSNRSHGKKCL